MTVQKIISLDKISKLSEKLKKSGKKIVLCHGVFDLLHIGHLRHFVESKTYGDVLIVTVTPDQYVNKGTNRPTFSSNLRMEALASIDAIDYIALNQWPDAIKTIKLIKPDVYCKGPDYKKLSNDLTGKISLEERSIKKIGGIVKYTQGEIYSSSKIINKYFNNFNKNQNDYLNKIKLKFNFREVNNLVTSTKNLKVLLIGETIIDQYVFCEALGKSGKEPVLALRDLSTEQYLGGAAAIAQHLTDFCKKISFITMIGEKQEHKNFILKNLPNNVKPYFIKKKNSPTIVKKRFIENVNQNKLLGVYQINDQLLNNKNENEIKALINKLISKHDLVIVSDYGHGFISKKSAAILCKSKIYTCLNAQTNAANIGYHTLEKYNKLGMVIINENELRYQLRDRDSDYKILMKILSKKISAKLLIVTSGKDGLTLYDKKNNKFLYCPAYASRIIDKIGAGDTMLAILSVLLKSKIDIDLSLFIGSLAAAESVESIGNSKFIRKKLLLKKAEHMMK